MTRIVIPSRSLISDSAGYIGERKIHPHWIGQDLKFCLIGNKEALNFRTGASFDGSLVDQGEFVGNLSTLGQRHITYPGDFTGLSYGDATGYDLFVFRFCMSRDQPSFANVFWNGNGFYRDGSDNTWGGLGSLGAPLYAAMVDGRWHTMCVQYTRSGAQDYAYFTLDGVTYRSDSVDWWNNGDRDLYLLSLWTGSNFGSGLISFFALFSGDTPKISLEMQREITLDPRVLFYGPDTSTHVSIIGSAGGAAIRRRNRLALTMI